MKCTTEKGRLTRRTS